MKEREREREAISPILSEDIFAFNWRRIRFRASTRRSFKFWIACHFISALIDLEKEIEEKNQKREREREKKRLEEIALNFSNISHIILFHL